MTKVLKKLWNKIITSEVLPLLMGLLAVFGMLAWLVAVFVFGVTTILSLVGVM